MCVTLGEDCIFIYSEDQELRTMAIEGELQSEINHHWAGRRNSDQNWGKTDLPLFIWG